ncbi:MAG: AI-2E family transporter [Anaeromyxobacteraceae bacterium]
MNDVAAEPRAPARARDPFRTALRVLAAAALAAAAWLAKDVLLLAFFAVIIAIVFSFPVNLLARVLPRGLAVLLVLLLGAGAAAAIGAFAAPTLRDQFDEMRETAPRAIEQGRAWIEQARASVANGGAAPQGKSSPRPGGEAGGGGGQADGPGEGGERGGGEAITRAGVQGLKALVAIIGALTESVLVIVLAAFLVHEPGLYRRGVRRLVPRAAEATFDELWSRLRDGLRRWVGGITVSMVIMGVVAALGLLAAGIESWLLLGVLTFLGTFVPYLGAIASAVPGLLVALAQSPRHLLLAAAVYLGVHLVEGYLVQPVIMRRAVEIKPALLLVGQSLFGAVFGLMGVVVATPALVCLQVAVEYLWIERRLGKEPA